MRKVVILAASFLLLSVVPAYAAVTTNISFTALNLNPGLVGWWTFDGKDMVQNVSDKSGQGNNGSLVNFGATSSSVKLGNIGQALRFDGTDDYVQLAADPWSTQLTSYTVSAWVNPTTVSGNTFIHSWRRAASTNIWYQLDRNNGDYRFLVGDGTNVGTASAVSAAVVGKWAHVVGVRNGNSLSIYVNGVLAGTDNSQTFGSITVTAATYPPRIGTQGEVAAAYWAGSLDDARIYTRALTAAEVSRFYNAGAGSRTSMSTKVPNLQNGLAGHWTFDGKDMVPNARDASGSGNHGNLTNFTSTTTTLGKVGQALVFDGSNDYVTHGDPTTFDGATGQTISAWVNTNSFSIQRAIVTKWDAAPAQQVWGNYLNTNGTFGYCVYHHTDWRNGSICITSNAALTTNKWYHVTSVWQASGNTMVLYINGVADPASPGITGTAPTSISNNTSALRIGNFVESGGANVKHFSGKMDDVRIYNRALTAAEASKLYKMGEAAHFSVTPQVPNLRNGLVGHWTFDGKDMISSVRDSSGLGNTGRLVGFTSTTSVKGFVGQALSFDGSDDQVTVPDSSSLDLRSNDVVSVFAWVKRASEQANAGVLWDNRSYFLQTKSGKFRLGHFKSDDVSWYGIDVNSPLASDGKWHHVGQVFDGSSTAVYVDGRIVTDLTVVNGTDGGGLGYGNADHAGYIGQSPTFATSAFGGAIDDVRIYNRALSAAEVKQLYNLAR